jgi:uncharacterized protein (DUF488 family)
VTEASPGASPAIPDLRRDRDTRHPTLSHRGGCERQVPFPATAALRRFCESAGIQYQPWPTLGSTAAQRARLKQTGDFPSFAKQFRAHAAKTMKSDLDRLAKSSQRIPTALLCYERLHEDCHRSVIAELIAERLDATVVAIQ